MKIKRLKLLSAFRGLPKGFDLMFSHSGRNDGEKLHPLCFVGLNGSGKSNVLEVLAEIFYYLECYHQAEKDEVKNFAFDFGFVVDYEISEIHLILRAFHGRK